MGTTDEEGSTLISDAGSVSPLPQWSPPRNHEGQQSTAEGWPGEGSHGTYQFWNVQGEALEDMVEKYVHDVDELEEAIGRWKSKYAER